MSLSAKERKKLKDTYRKRQKRGEERCRIQVEAGTTLKQVVLVKSRATIAAAVTVTFQLPSRSTGWTGPRVAPYPTILSVPDVFSISGLTLVSSDPRYAFFPSLRPCPA